MNRKERTLASLELVRPIILALLTAIFSVFGYVEVLLYQANHLIWFTIIGVLATLALFFFLYITFRYYIRLMDDLENSNG